MEAGWPTLSTDGAMCRLDMEADRLLCDDGRTLLWRPRAGKARRDRRVKGWAATGQHVGSHMRQGGRERLAQEKLLRRTDGPNTGSCVAMRRMGTTGATAGRRIVGNQALSLTGGKDGYQVVMAIA